MKNYFDKLESRLNRWKSKYRNNPRKVAMKMVLWNLSCLFKKHLVRLEVEELPERKSKPISWIHIEDKEGKDISGLFPVDYNEIRIPKFPAGARVEFHLDTLMKFCPHIKRFGFVFFLGVGDYFYATRFFEIMKEKYPHIHFDAYVSTVCDSNNSPLVADCLKVNPLFEHIYTYHGSRNIMNWYNYDYAECYQIKSKDTVLLPVIYNHNANTFSRTRGLCEVYANAFPMINLRPIIYPYRATAYVTNLFSEPKKKMKKVVFVQMSARSSGYSYPYTDELIKALLDQGYFVVTVEKTAMKSNRLLKLNTKQMKITDSIAFVKMIKDAHIPLYFLTLASCFWSISSALDLPNLGLHHFYDDSIATYHFSNIFVVSASKLPNVPSDRLFIAPPAAFEQDKTTHYYTYKPEYILKAFDVMLYSIGVKRDNK